MTYFAEKIPKTDEEFKPHKIPVKNSCGKEVRDQDGNWIITCGDELGGDNGEFAQCGVCRTKDFYDYGKQEERERIIKKIDEVYEKETLKYNYVEIYNFVQKLKQEI